MGEDLNGVGEGCKSRDGRRGECKINSGDVDRDCGEDGEFITGRCPGPNNVQCCLRKRTVTPAVSGVGEGCKSRDGRRGECKINSGDVDRDCGEDGEFITGRCPGPNNVQCCLRKRNFLEARAGVESSKDASSNGISSLMSKKKPSCNASSYEEEAKTQ